MTNCMKCDLGKYREENHGKIVWGTGNPASKIILMGEAPGKDESISGKPFVGRSGKKLRDILSDYLDLEKDTWVSNTVLCRPPDNRNPKPQEQEACFPHLESTFFIIKPKLVLTVGRVPSDWLSRIVNQSYNIYKMQEAKWCDLWFLWLPLYHPSYLIRKPSAVEPFIACLQRYKDIIDKLRSIQ